MGDFEWGDLPRGGRGTADEALAAIDELLAHPACAARPVDYQIEQVGTVGRPTLAGWMREGEAQGYTEIHYSVDPLEAGPVVVRVWATMPLRARTGG